MNEIFLEAIVSVAITGIIWFVMYFLLKRARHITYAQPDLLWRHLVLQETLVREQLETFYQPLTASLQEGRANLLFLTDQQPREAMTRNELEAYVLAVDPLFFSRLERIKALLLQRLCLVDSVTMLECAQAFLNGVSAWQACSAQEICGVRYLSALFFQVRQLDWETHLELHNLQNFHALLKEVRVTPAGNQDVAGSAYSFWSTLRRRERQESPI